MSLVVLLTVLVLLSALAVPLAFSILGACLATIVLFRPSLPVELAAQQMIKGIDSFSLIAIGLFLFAGELMNSGGITKRIVDFASALVGHIRGGLGHVCIVASMIISGISGSAVADGAAIGSVMVPAMKRANYPAAFAAALCETAAVMGPIIPPSIPMVIYAILAEVSVGRMFLAGLLPGVLIGVLMMIGVYVMSRARGYPRGSWGGFAAVGRAFTAAFAALLTPLIILGGILGGVFTATESAAVACVYCLGVGAFVYRELGWRDTGRALVGAANGTASVMVIVGASALMGWLIADLGISRQMSELIFSMTRNPLVFLAIINVFFLIVGLFMDPLAALIVFVPILLPSATGLGIDPIHFGLIVVINLMIGLCTPPVGYLIYLLAAIAGEPPKEVIRESLPLLGILLAVLLAVTYVPALALGLPRLLLG
ncbi:TRAP transporter large permease [Ramlibacter ginsenosidimutans]|uniref:TRAP transporter large permease protein n=1 Tax=Ramlibacter ginsenosidimutans TaxID=502333 RepID=A0A934WNG6_9BURK|nr:TRAP transporter large permease [Ramlibacter ginsenosidimutans]MBK6007187.1 TRAP transporter large permease [Ramlibacter ginsenosidimutans]